MELSKVALPGERFHEDGYRIHAATAFRALDGQMIVECPYRWWAYSPDGVSFRELSTVSRTRSHAKGKDRQLLAYEDPFAARTGWLFVHWGDWPGDPRDDSAPIQVELDGISFTQVDAPTEIMLLSLPPMRVADHTYWQPSTGQVIHLSLCQYADGGGHAYGGIRADGSEKLFVGDAADVFAGGIADLTEAQIDRLLPEAFGEYVITYPTAEGTLDVPFGDEINKRRVATWEGAPLVELMPERLLIMETDDRVRLCLNPGHSSWDTNTHPQTSETAWDELMADAHAWRPVQPIVADIWDPAKRAHATVDLGPSVDLAELVELLCPALARHPVRLVSSLAGGISHLLVVGRLGRRVLIRTPEDPRAAVILERCRYIELLSSRPAERDGAPVIELTCRLTADTDPTTVRLKLAITHAESVIESKSLEYVIDDIEAENTHAPNSRG